jgi:hypothetical protein
MICSEQAKDLPGSTSKDTLSIPVGDCICGYIFCFDHEVAHAASNKICSISLVIIQGLRFSLGTFSRKETGW